MAGRNLFAEPGGRDLFAADLAAAPLPKDPAPGQKAAGLLGLDPTVQQRNLLLPRVQSAQGETEWGVPQIVIDMMESGMLPGHVAQGGGYSQEDVTKMALDVGMLGSPLSKARGLSGKGYRAGAPSTQQLFEKGDVAYKALRSSGKTASTDSYSGALRDLNMVAAPHAPPGASGLDPVLHPKSARALKVLNRYDGQSDVNMGELQKAREVIQTASTTLEKKDRAIGRQLLERFDDYLEQFPEFKPARRDWARAKRSARIEDIIETAQDAASGVENGLRIGFRKLLSDIRKGKEGGWSKDEIGAMKQLVEGGATQKTLRILSKLGFGNSGSSNFIGGSIGAGLGYSVAGVPGAVAVSAGGLAAGAAKGARAVSKAKNIRAATATGRKLPKPKYPIPSRSLMGPTLGAQRENQRQDVLRRFLQTGA